MIDKPVPKLELADLMRLWNDSTQADKSIFSEMRTNLQIVAGQHYLSEGSAFWNRIRDNKQLSEAQRIKLTKNHSQRVTTIYRNTIESVAADVAIEPNNSNELRDQKATELHSAYWEYIKNCENFPSLRAQAIKHLIEIGEMWIKVFWSMDGGQHIGNLAQMVVDPETGEQVPLEENGEIVTDPNQPQYSGKVKFELIEGYNIKRDKDARTFKESPFIGIDKLIPLNALRSKFNNEEIIKKLEQSRPTDQMVIYDGNSRSYQAAVGMCLVREFYWRPGPSLPNGYYHFFTDVGIIDQGELPYGIWPLHGETFEEQTGNPRGYSIIRPIRPPQVEINRCASKIAEHQITLGDDKAWVPVSTKLNQGATLPGVRVNTYSGQKPEITEGRSGEQYLPYLEAQINELYTLANLPEIVKEEQESPDLYTNLFKSFRFKRKFTIYGEKVERFFCEVVKTALRIAKASCSEQELIPAIGKSEYLNIPEFKNADDLSYMIRVKPRVDDLETQFGKQVTLNHILQYVGPNLQKEDIGKMIRLSPFLNKEQMFSEMTSKYDRAVNDILAMDRGQFRPARPNDDHVYTIEALSARMSKADYELLPAPIKFMYEAKLKQHEQIKAQQLLDLQAAQAGFIPSGGFLVACDFYVPDPNNPQSSKRVRIPSESIEWLIDRLKKQGSDLEKLEQLPAGVLADMGNMLPRQKLVA